MSKYTKYVITIFALFALFVAYKLIENERIKRKEQETMRALNNFRIYQEAATKKRFALLEYLSAMRKESNFQRVQELINQGSEINTVGNLGDSPLHMAVITNNEKIVKLLLDKGAKVNVKNLLGFTPISLAVSISNINIAKLLLEKGANVNERNSPFGNSLLHDSVSLNKIEMVKLLISKGASVNAKNDMGFTPFDLAKTENMKTLLLVKGAKR